MPQATNETFIWGNKVCGVTQERVWCHGSAVPVEGIESITDESPGTNWGKLCGWTVTIFCVLIFLLSFAIDRNRRSDADSKSALFWGGLVGTLIGVGLLSIPHKKQWRVHLNQTFNRSNTVSFDSVAQADAFVRALTQSKGGRLPIARETISWFFIWSW